jgi:hypothetical protein
VGWTATPGRSREVQRSGADLKYSEGHAQCTRARARCRRTPTTTRPRASSTKDTGLHCPIEPVHCIASKPGHWSVRRAAATSRAYASGHRRRLENVPHNYPQRGAGRDCCSPPGAADISLPKCTHSPGTALPNPSLNRTRYGKHRKPELRHMVHHLSSGLRRLPPQAG